MKQKILINYVIFFTFTVISFAQIQPPEIKFINLEENWLYISKDSNFVKSPLDPYSTPYWGRQPQEIIFDEDNIYILEITVSQSPYSGIEGSLLHKIDIHSGNSVWVNYNNTYVGNAFREFYMIDAMRKLNDGNIEIVGYRDIDTIDFTQPQWWGFSGKPIKKIINNSNGEFTDVVVSKDSVRARFNDALSGFNRIITLSNGDYIQFSKNLYLENGELRNSIDFYDIDDSMQIDTPFFKKIEYNTELNIPISLSIVPQFRKLNAQTVIISFSKIDTSSYEDSPNEFKLIWLDISDKGSIGKTKEIDLTNDIVFPQNQYNEDIKLTTKNDNIFLSQYCYESLSPIVKFYWFAWYDKYGKQLGKIDRIKDENDNYYNHILPMGIYDGAAYIAAKKNDYTYDILKTEVFSNQLEKIGQIKIRNTQDIIDLYVWRTEFLPNEKILICMNITKNNEFGKRTNFTYYYNFDIEDLGILTKTENFTIDKNFLEISPNPSKDEFIVKFKKTFSGRLEILDTYGRIITKKILSNIISTKIKTVQFKNGVYILVGKGNDNKEFRKRIMVVK
jgi:hypothetical protein